MKYENVKLEDIYLMVDCYNLIVANAIPLTCLLLTFSSGTNNDSFMQTPTFYSA